MFHAFCKGMSAANRLENGVGGLDREDEDGLVLRLTVVVEAGDAVLRASNLCISTQNG